MSFDFPRVRNYLIMYYNESMCAVCNVSKRKIGCFVGNVTLSPYRLFDFPDSPLMAKIHEMKHYVISRLFVVRGDYLRNVNVTVLKDIEMFCLRFLFGVCSRV